MGCQQPQVSKYKSLKPVMERIKLIAITTASTNMIDMGDWQVWSEMEEKKLIERHWYNKLKLLKKQRGKHLGWLQINDELETKMKKKNGQTMRGRV